MKEEKRLEELEIELVSLLKKRNIADEKYHKIRAEFINLKDKIKKDEEYKLWKAKEGKYYYINLFVPEEDKLKTCNYVHILKVERIHMLEIERTPCIEYEIVSINKDGYNQVWITNHEMFIKFFGKFWKEISKKEYDKIRNKVLRLERKQEEK